MNVAQQQQKQSKENRQLVLVHRPPAFDFPFRNRLEQHFDLFDPLDFPHQSSHVEFQTALCVDPTPISKEFLSLLPSLQLIVGSSAGIDHIVLTECWRRGIQVTTAGSAFSEDVADYAVGLLIDVLRKISASDRFVRAGLWGADHYPLGFKLGGKRIGIVGLGNIGSQVAKRLASFGCTIAYTSRKEKPFATFPYYSNIHDLAINSDVLILTCALTNETHHMVNRDVMEALGKNGVIINVGRGALIDEQELVKFLAREELRSAGFDVFENEPDVPKELFTMDNAVLSHHVAAVTPECFEALEELIVYNLKAFFENTPLRSVVNLE